ncbi:MAG: hypothetical protein VB877_03045 [Pirellulaceae bacterium]
MPRKSIWIHAVTCLTICLFSGCSPDKDSSTNGSAPSTDPHAGHNHESLGPHQGYLVGLGDEEYHAEWRFDTNTGKITIYLLDADAKKDASTTADKLSITVTRDGETSDYSLPAINQDDADPPAASQFELVDTNLVEFLRAVGHGIEANLTVSIGDKEYTGPFEHLPH